MSLEDIKRKFGKLVEEGNNSGLADFEGYSPAEMHQIMYLTFNPGNPIQLQRLEDNDYNQIPMLNQIKYLANLIEKAGEIKLTNKGFLPTRIVAELYQQRFITDISIELKLRKLYKETDAISINLTRILLELSGLVKKRNGKLSLTAAGRKTLSDNHALLHLILTTFTKKFNWAYYDIFNNQKTAQLGYGFTLILLSKYGDEKRLDSFYAEKYFRAFPMLKDFDDYPVRCYSVRSFKRFLNYFGLISIESSGPFIQTVKYITKTDIFDKLIKVTPPKSA